MSLLDRINKAMSAMDFKLDVATVVVDTEKKQSGGTGNRIQPLINYVSDDDEEADQNG